MKHIKTIHIIGLICIADLIFASQGFFTVLILIGYGLYRLEKCVDCNDVKEPVNLDQHPIPKEPKENLPLNPNPDPFDRGNSNITPDKKF